MNTTHLDQHLDSSPCAHAASEITVPPRNPARSFIPESLTIRKRLKNGGIEAVQAWATGWQVLVFDDFANFNRFKKSIDVRNARNLEAQS